MTQPTSGGAVTADANCCANCVGTSRPQQWGPNLSFLGESRQCGPAGWLALLLIKAGDESRSISAKNNTQIPGPAICTENPDSHLTQT